MLKSFNFYKLISLFLFFFICLALFLVINDEKENKRLPEVKTLPEQYSNGAWIWQSPQKITEDEFEKMIAFAVEKNIKIIYLFIEDYLYISENPDIKDKDNQIKEFNAKVKKLISIANEKGIEIEALAGASNWADSSHKYIPPMLLDYVLDFNARAPDSVKFSGIQFDIEFYNKDDFKKNKAGSTLNYLTLVSELAQKIDKQISADSSLRLGFAIPHSLANESGQVPKISFGGKNQTVLGHLLDILNKDNYYLVLMSYRNQALGKNGSIAISQKSIEIAESKQSRTKIYIGMETEENKDKNITFFGKKQSELNEAAEEIANAFSAYVCFSGLSVHTLSGYQNLPED